MLVTLRPHGSDLNIYTSELKNPTVYVVNHTVLKRVELKKDGCLKQIHIQPVEQKIHIIDELPRVGWRIKDDAELEDASIWRNQITSAIKLIVTNPEGYQVYVDANSVLKLFLKGLHVANFDFNEMYINEYSQLICPEFEVEEDD